MADDLQAWTNAFYKRMRSSPSVGTGPITTPTGVTLADLLVQSQMPKAASSAQNVAMHADPIESDPNWFQRTIDVISRPLYATGNLIEAAANNRATDGRAKQDIWEEVGKGWTGKDKTLPSDVIRAESDLPGWAEFTLGLGADIVLDPLNLIPGAAIAGGARAVRGAVSGSSKAKKALDTAAKEAKRSKEAEEASAIAAQKVKEAEVAGANLDQSVVDQVLKDSEAATTPKTVDDLTNLAGIQKMFDDLENPLTGADDVRSMIPNAPVSGTADVRPPYLDPETIVPGAQQMRYNLENTDDLDMLANLRRIQTPDDMKAWRAMYKNRFPKIEQNGLSATRDPARFRELAENFISRSRAPQDTTISDVLLNPGMYDSLTIGKVLKEHNATSISDLAHKYRFTPDTMDTRARTIVTGPVHKLDEVAAEEARLAAGNSMLDDTIAVQQAARAKNAGQRAQDAEEASKTAQQSARQTDATQTRTTPPKVYGNDAQGKSIQKFVREANKENRDLGLKGAQAAAATRERALERLENISNLARAQGDDLFVHRGVLGPDTRRFMISTAQVMRTMVNNSPETAALLDRSMFNASTSIGTEGFQQGVAEALRQYDDFLRDPVNARSGLWPRADDSVTDEILAAIRGATDDDYMKTWTHPTGDAKRQAYFRKMLPEMQRNQEEIALALEKLAPQLAEEASRNIAARTATNVNDANAIADTVNSAVDAAVANGAASGLREISEATADIKAASTTVGASPQASYEAAARVATQIREKYGVTQDQVRRLRQTAEARVKHGPRAEAQINRLNREEARATIKEADDAGRAALGPEYDYDISQQVGAAITNGFMKIIAPLGRRFSYGFQAGELATIIKEGRSAAYTIGKRYERLLKKILKTTTREQQLEMMTRIRMLDKPAVGTPERALYDDLKESLDITYDTSAFESGSSLFTNWFAQGVPLEEINKAFAAVKLPQRFKPPKKGEDWSDVPSQWKTWEIDDPVDFAHKSFEAMQRVASFKSAGTYAAAKWGVKKPPNANWVRLTDKTGESHILPYMDKDLYYPKELAAQVANLDWLLKQTLAPNHKFVREVVDPYMQLWKPLVTIARPGHHIRNMTGDMFISALDLGFRGLAPAYAKATRIMKGNRAFEGARAITQTGQLVEKIGPNAGKERLGVVLRGGEKVMLDDANTYKLAFQRGLLPEFTKSEDLIMNEGTGLLAKAATKLQTSKPMQKIGGFAEVTSHVGRLAHFVALMEKKSFTRKYGSLEEASRAAAERIKKFHPDTSGLTPFEQKYMRRLIPFYTWFRQTSPVVMGAMFTKPGRVMAVPKIQYNIAQQMGVNPDSLGNPFPDGLYPSWVRDSMSGPITPEGLMMNMGSPQEGLLPDFLSVNPEEGLGGLVDKPLRSLANMTNNFIKQPYEWATGTKVQTGTPITDQSEFWDQIIPGASVLNQLTSSSLSGTAGNLATGAGIDPLRSVQKGDQDRFFNRSLANFWLGLGFTNANTPSTLNSAFYERVRGG